MQNLAATSPLSRHWLLLAIGAIGLSALFAILLVVARTPLLQQLFPAADLFHTALVLHVDFSVLVWLLAFAALLWSLAGSRAHPLLDPLALWLALAGVLLLALSPLLTPPPQPVMSNYIPILHSPAFLTGLCAFAAGIGLAALRRLLLHGATTSPIAEKLAALAMLVTLLLFALTAWQLPKPITSAGQFEALFWGGGHLLQLVYLLLLIGAWQRLLPPPAALPSRLLTVTTALLLLIGLGLAVAYEPHSPAYREGYTQLMRLGLPLVILPPTLLLWSHPAAHAIRLSQLLLLAGLLLGLLISGDNVSVTAHYHATNAAITLAFLSLAYRLLPKLGLGTPHQGWSQRQGRLYFSAMLLYIAGLALSGQLEVPRKVAMNTEGWQAVAMGLMGLGGLAAVSATLLFVAIQLRALWRHHGHTNPTTTAQRGRHETTS